MRRKILELLPYAQEFSKEIGVPSIANKVDAEQFFETNRLIQWYLDEPYAQPGGSSAHFGPRTPASTSGRAFRRRCR